MGKDSLGKSGSKHAIKALPKLIAHEFANMLPIMSEADFKSLKADIERIGLADPIELYHGQILDGRNRYNAFTTLREEGKLTARILKTFKTVVFKGTDDEAFQRVCSRETRRQVSESQRATAAVVSLPHLEAQALKRMEAGGSASVREGEKGKAAEIAASLFRVSARYVEMAKKLANSDANLFRDVFEGKLPLTRAMHESRRRQNRARIALAPVELKGWESNCDLQVGDVLERLEVIPSKSVRVICTDPPYNLKKKYHADRSGDARKDREFIEWCAKWLSECKRVLTPDGSIFVMMTARYIGRLDVAMRELGFHFRNTAYWWENNPENQAGNFSDAVRPVLYFTRSPDAFLFNDDCRVDSRRNVIKDKRGLKIGKVPDNVWIENRIPGNSGDRVPFEDAPPQIPVSIPELCIRVASEPGDTILDPFNGNGTTAIAALLAGRKYIGIDQSKKYLDQSRKWIPAQLAKLSKARAA